jgi:hypothetical protein
MKARILVIVGTLILVIGSGIGIGSGGAAFAQSGQDQWCWEENELDMMCLSTNGDSVVVGSPGSASNIFFVTENSETGFINMVYQGVGAASNECVSDYGNSSTDARAGLNGYCLSGEIAWGANFELYNCGPDDSGFAFKNVHWGGWLAPASENDGAAFYLNSSTEQCFTVEPG